ncbi:flagellar basal-body rod protein FlgF [Agaribacter flavus]|uniref:Flagellar basal-body rod protein FlgF n=1 Tax=Agaribacter flavus TaxID=1902781 RepID=A0ABV7FQ34_9ALTE
MFQSFFTGLSGMLSFSQNLDNVSNNISNLNTPGFKGSDTFYSSLTSGENAFGTQISGQQQRFTEGEVRQTGNPGDLAISGQGFFVLMNNGEINYTKAGQFIFNDDGILVDSVSGGRVAAITDDGKLEEININEVGVLAPQATSKIDFIGNLSTDMSSFTVADVDVFTGLGEQRQYRFEFTNTSATEPGSWSVRIVDDNGADVHTGEIRFDSQGTPVNNFSKINFQVEDSLGGETTVEIDFGTNASFAKGTSVSGGDTSTLRASVIDGYGVASLTTVDFTADGQLTLNYSNGEAVDGPYLALANFTNLSTLSVVQGSIFQAGDNTTRIIGRANESGLGSILSESIELSNVDLSREFADMIIIQRGYQASSRILNVANQLLEQLYENTRGR